MENKFKREWLRLEAQYPRPERVRHLIRREWRDFRNKIRIQDTDFVKTVVGRLYAGDVYILKNAFPKEWMERLRENTFKYFKSKPSEFHKMLEGTPDFHRKIDLETGKKYAFKVCKHSAFFYPWNQDPLNVFPNVYRRWRPIKWLMGLEEKAYERNTPKDGVVDRIQIAQYPSKIGYLEPHSDPYLHQRLFFSGYISKRGENYTGGGFYLVGKDDSIVEAESDIEIGDIGIGFATVVHGVAPCNLNKKPDWNSQEGRWFLSMYSNASDVFPQRHTGYPVNINHPEVFP